MSVAKQALFTPATVLIIDDDPFVLEPMQVILESAGYVVIAAQNGLQAVEILSEQHTRINVIVVDLMMPGMDGFMFLEWLRQEAGSTLPVLVQTAVNRIKTTSRLIDLGANDVLIKPAQPSELLERLQQLLSLRLQAI
ncbi:MAG: response regulator transcription factor [Gammaproteobacteria bacterium]|nr:response regulator transcription factor [Gammaproteobacteria bacterium]